MALQSVKNVLDEDSRGMRRTFQGSDKEPSQVVDHWIENSVAPRKLIHAGEAMGFSHFIESGLREVKHDRVERIREQNGGLIAQVDHTHAAGWVEAARHPLLAKELLDERYGPELQHNQVTIFSNRGTRDFGETLSIPNSRECERLELRKCDLSGRRVLQIHRLSETVP